MRENSQSHPSGGSRCATGRRCWADARTSPPYTASQGLAPSASKLRTGVGQTRQSLGLAHASRRTQRPPPNRPVRMQVRGSYHEGIHHLMVSRQIGSAASRRERVETIPEKLPTADSTIKRHQLLEDMILLVFSVHDCRVGAAAPRHCQRLNADRPLPSRMSCRHSCSQKAPSCSRQETRYTPQSEGGRLAAPITVLTPIASCITSTGIALRYPPSTSRFPRSWTGGTSPSCAHSQTGRQCAFLLRSDRRARRSALAPKRSSGSWLLEKNTAKSRVTHHRHRCPYIGRHRSRSVHRDFS